MFRRNLSLPKDSSFFLFGPRGTGKSTLIREHCVGKDVLEINLLESEQEDIFARHPDALLARLAARAKPPDWVFIDEVQKVPRLLDAVHRAMDTPRYKNVAFALTGSSARKLKRGAANLLAGRAFVYALFPLTQSELGDAFVLDDILQWGSLPRIFGLRAEERVEFLRAYALTYLKEEVVAEQLVRQLQPFRVFLEVAAQCNGQVLNFARMARDVGADPKTVQSYFDILQDTLTGFLLPAFHVSLRKRQRSHPKFYFFDLGVKRALERVLDQPVSPRTYGFGFAFEHFVILEIVRRANYARKDWTFSYFATTDGGEIDLVVSLNAREHYLVAIKSTNRIGEHDTKALQRYLPDIPGSKAYCVSRDPNRVLHGDVLCLPWFELFAEWGV